MILNEPTTRHEALARLLDTLTTSQVDVLGEQTMRLVFGSVAEFARGGRDVCIVDVSDLKELRGPKRDLTIACCDRIDALIAGDES